MDHALKTYVLNVVKVGHLSVCKKAMSSSRGKEMNKHATGYLQSSR